LFLIAEALLTSAGKAADVAARSGVEKNFPSED